MWCVVAGPWSLSFAAPLYRMKITMLWTYRWTDNRMLFAKSHPWSPFIYVRCYRRVTPLVYSAHHYVVIIRLQRHLKSQIRRVPIIDVTTSWYVNAWQHRRFKRIQDWMIGAMTWMHVLTLGLAFALRSPLPVPQQSAHNKRNHHMNEE